MAELLESHDFRAGHGNCRYPWKQWADGATWKITRGVDFSVSPKSMQRQIRTRGVKDGRLTRSNVHGDSLIFCFQRTGERSREFLARVQAAKG